MPKLSVMIPCYNEEENARPIYEAVTREITTSLPGYDYEILFIDNKSTDGTREILRAICAEDKHVKAIFNLKNFGQFNSPYYGLTQTDGDCVIPLCADFQDPVELIPVMVHKWEEGHKVITMVKRSSRESRLMYFLRGCYYKLIKRMSDVKQIEQFTGFGLYDRSFIEVLRTLKDPIPFIRGIVAEYAPDHLEIPYEQPRRRAGKTHNNFSTLYDAAMISFTTYTTGLLRFVTFFGAAVCGLTALGALACLIVRLVTGPFAVPGLASILLSVFFVGGLILGTLGFLGEYIVSINRRVIGRPLVIEEERINFED
ncbi:MAG: glycosyltransferase family 2 protein [Clostridia bacterium]|nr:glycosyltransferase family 2 protein [Clostridia bacterium]